VTYCIGILVDEGVVLASDSRTNAGIDRVSTFRKMFTFEKPGERFFALLTAGNLSLTQGVISLISEWLNSENPERRPLPRELDVRHRARHRHGDPRSAQD
jgi:putative proteasome-type protease